MTQSNMTVSKLQSEAVKEFRTEFVKEYPDGSIRWLRGIWIEDIETLIQDQIDKAYSKGREEESKRIYKEADKIVARNIDDNGQWDSMKIITQLVKMLEDLSIQSKEK